MKINKLTKLIAVMGGATSLTGSCLALNLTSCSNKEKTIDEIANEYAKNFTSWYEKLTVNPDKEWFKHVDGPIDYEADAIMALTYYPGWEIWNGKCHENQGDIPSQIWEDKAKATAGIPSAEDWRDFNKQEKYEWNINYGSYKTLENALKKSKCAPITTYHGFEYQEKELLTQINQLLDLNQTSDFWKSIDNKQEFRKCDLSKLKDKVLNYDGFCCTSLNKDASFGFLAGDFAADYQNVVMYEIDIDENTYGGYVSDTNHLFYDRTLAWCNEYQIALANKLKLKVKDAYWTESPNNKNVLYLKVQGYHE